MKRGSSGLSLIVGVDKPAGRSSHDIVNAARRIFGERRCGHTGTLDPFATGVLPICIGPATRLDQFMTAHDKRYRVSMTFGFETDTDDCTGAPTETSDVPTYLFDRDFADAHVRALIGKHLQVPPAYSAVKVNGKRAYAAARAGEEVALEPREVEVYEAALVDVSCPPDAPRLSWTFDVAVSKGTYIRSLVRDLGRSLMCPAHVSALARMKAGRIEIAHCHSLQSLESLGVAAALDPVRVLGFRFAFGDGVERFVNSGTKLYASQVELCDPLPMDAQTCACTTGVCASDRAADDGEIVSIVVQNRLKALYAYDAAHAIWKPACVFSTSIYRG